MPSIEQFQALLDSAAEGLIAVDLAGRCTYANRAAVALLAPGTESLGGADVHALLHPGHVDAGDCWLAAAARGQATSWHSDWPSATRGALRIRCTATPLREGDHVAGVAVTAAEMPAALYDERADRIASLGRLAATMAHEFNNVLMGIAPFAELIRRRSANAATTQAAEHIQTAVRRGKAITGDVLRFSNPRQPVRAPLDLAPWLAAIHDEVRVWLPANVFLDVRSDPELVIDGDSGQLRQIMANLIVNARDAMPHGGRLTIEARRETSSARFPFGSVDHPERFAHFIVDDTGCGISPQDAAHVFEPLFTTKRTGTGLGLAVVWHIVRSHGGTIFLESTVGRGTAFHIFLPLAQRPGAEEMTAEAPAPTASRPLRVLLVEDDEVVADGTRALLEMERHSIDIASSGKEGLQAVRDGQYDVVILDVGLPDMAGQRVYDEITALRPDLPVIVSTGHASELTGARAPLVHLQKPYDGATLLSAIREATFVSPEP